MNKKIRNKNWDIKKVSKNHEIFELIEEWKKINIKEAKLRNNAIKSLINFKEWYLTFIKTCELDDKVNVIYSVYSDKENKTDEEKDWLQERSRAISALEEIWKNLVDIDDLFIKNEKKIRTYLKDKQLEKYKTKIEVEFFAGAKHNLDETNKKVSKALGGIEPFLEIEQAMVDDYNIPRVFDKYGRKYCDVTWNDLFTQQDKNVRKAAYESLYAGRAEHRRTLSTLMYYLADRMQQMSKLHNYNSEVDWKAGTYYHMSCKKYWYIIDQCNKFAKAHIKYRLYIQKLITQAYGLKKFEPWDEELEIKNIMQEVDIPTCKQVVLESLKPLGEEYCKRIQQLFSKDIIKWKSVGSIDANGACYAVSSAIDENPINVDWDGTMSGAITLSHECGHNLKNLYSKLNNEINNNTDKINAEIASIVNEFLTCFYLIDKYKKEKNPNYLYGAYKSIFSYFFKNVSGLGFHCQYRDTFVHHFLKGKDVKPTEIERIYLNAKKEYYGLTQSEYKLYASGKSCYFLERMKAYSLYLGMAKQSNSNALGYYIGCILGLVIAHKIYNGDKKVLANYLKFLKTGNDTNPFKATKVLGVDILKPQIYTESKQLISKIVSDFIKTIKI